MNPEARRTRSPSAGTGVHLTPVGERSGPAKPGKSGTSGSHDDDQRRVRTGRNEDVFPLVMQRLCDALEPAGIPFLFMGGVASMVHGRTSWTHDLDVFVRRADEPEVEKALVAAGFHHDDEVCSGWLTKYWLDDVMIDVINTSSGPVYLDDDMFARGENAVVWSRNIRVLAPEDLIVTKALAQSEETAHYWWDALSVLASRELDWAYLVERARRGPRRILSLLLYAQSIDLAVPDRVIEELWTTTLGGSVR